MFKTSMFLRDVLSTSMTANLNKHALCVCFYSNQTSFCCLLSAAFECICMWAVVFMHLRHSSRILQPGCAPTSLLCSLHFDLICLVAVFVCVVPSARPIPLQSQVEHNRIPTIPLCSGLPALRAGRVYRSHRPLIMFLVYQIEARPAVLSHSPSDTHTRAHWRSE